MKTLSGYQLENPMHKVTQAIEQMNFSTPFLTNINTYIMNKLTSVSPFLLLLVPVFMMMVITLSSGTSNINKNEVSIKSATPTEILKLADRSVK